ncbi:MAG: FliG C-terminal domain-containing protein [Mycobacteriales bacterium]
MSALATPVPTGRRKAAVALVALGPERAAAVLRGLEESEVKALVAEVAALGPVSPDEVREALSDLARSLAAPGMLPAPGKRFAKDLLVRALGEERGTTLGDELDVPAPFAWLAEADPDAAAKSLATEPAGAVALALAHLEPKAAARLLTRLPAPDRARVATRIAALGAVHPDTVRQVEAGLRSRVEDVLRTEVRRVDGPELLAGLLQRTGRDTSRELLQAVAATSPELADATRAALFTFDDVCGLEPRAMQVLLRSVDTRQLAIALTSVSEAATARVLSNLSERAKENLLEEMDLLTGLRPAEVTEARNGVVATARQLEEEGSLVLTTNEDDD